MSAVCKTHLSQVLFTSHEIETDSILMFVRLVQSSRQDAVNLA